MKRKNRWAVTWISLEEDLPKKYAKRTAALNRRYAGRVYQDRVTIVRVVQSILEENTVLVHVRWTEWFDIEGFENKVLGEIETFYGVIAETRRVFEDD